VIHAPTYVHVPPLPKSISNLTIVMTGPPLSMKSVVANYLHRFLRTGLVESAYLGPAILNGHTDEQLRSARRTRLLAVTMVYAKEALPVIVDAAFHRRRDRVEFAKKLRARTTTDLIWICCYSDDHTLREFRRQRRNTAKLPLEVEFQPKENAEELHRKYEQLTSEDPYPFLFFNPDRNVIELGNDSMASKEINVLLRDLDLAVREGAANGWR
jgi:predicted kinase